MEVAARDAAEAGGAAKGIIMTRRISVFILVACFLGLAALIPAVQHSSTKAVHHAASAPYMGAKLFDSPQQAAEALVQAAENFDVSRLTEIFGPEGDDVIFTGEFAQDRKVASEFAAEARQRVGVSMSKSGIRAFVLVGRQDWPFPVPLVKRGEKWCFDSKSGRRELLNRRIGANELDAIAVCRGYVEAQNEYAHKPREGYDVNQYAQRIVSTPGKQDGLAWQEADGKWSGPIGENIAQAIEQGYVSTGSPYHGYFFKILKGQGRAAPLGEMDYVVNGVMIGGFALVAAPAEYDVTGVRTFIVSHDGVVYEKDLGPKTMAEFQAMQRFNPDKTWKRVVEEESSN